MSDPSLDADMRQIRELACWKALVRTDPVLARTVKQLVRLGAEPARIGRTALEGGQSRHLAATVENAAAWIRDRQPNGWPAGEPQAAE